MSESIYSLFHHIQTPDHSLQSSFAEGLLIVFPHFSTKAVLGIHDIYLDALPVTHHLCDSSVLPESSLTTDQFCWNLKEFTTEVTKETKYLDNLLKNLREYYKEVKTKRQLNYEVPAGFWQDTILNRL